jgi:hypothetical protein
MGTGWAGDARGHADRRGWEHAADAGTGGLSGARIWEDLIGQVLAFPPPCRPVPGSSLDRMRAGDRAVVVAESGLTGPVGELVAAVPASGNPA